MVVLYQNHLGYNETITCHHLHQAYGTRHCFNAQPIQYPFIIRFLLIFHKLCIMIENRKYSVSMSFDRARAGTLAKGLPSENGEPIKQYLGIDFKLVLILMLLLLTHRPNLRAKYIISNMLLSVAYYMQTSNDSRPNRSFHFY